MDHRGGCAVNSEFFANVVWLFTFLPSFCAGGLIDKSVLIDEGERFTRYIGKRSAAFKGRGDRIYRSSAFPAKWRISISFTVVLSDPIEDLIDILQIDSDKVFDSLIVQHLGG